MIHKLKQIYMKEMQMFAPSFLGIFMNPFYFIRNGLYRNILANKNFLKGRLLDFGCGQKPYKDFFDVEEYIGLDIEKSGHDHKNEKIDVYYDGKKIPFDNNYFDSVFSSEVFEHIFNLEEILSEIYRVTKPGGHLLATMPFVWDEHEIPYDFARYTSFGIDHLVKKAGFETILIDKSTNYVETVFQMWNAYIAQYVMPKNVSNELRLLLTVIFIAPVTITGIFLSKILPQNKNFYHNNIIVARKPDIRINCPNSATPS
jgi:SAM-dependent methyltransferase